MVAEPIAHTIDGGATPLSCIEQGQLHRIEPQLRERDPEQPDPQVARACLAVQVERDSMKLDVDANAVTLNVWLAIPREILAASVERGLQHREACLEH